jgi:hypothetical protein
VASLAVDSEDLLLRQALEALSAQQLPRAVDPRCWGGHGIGLACDLCGLPISSDDVEIEAAAITYGPVVRFHSNCYAQWQRACCQLLGDRAAGSAATPPDVD